MVDSEVGEAQGLLGVFLCGFCFFNSVAWDGFGLSQAKCKHLSYDRAACSEGKDHSHQLKEKHIPVYTTGMDPPMTGTSGLRPGTHARSPPHHINQMLGLSIW